MFAEDRPVLSVGGHERTWVDVIAAARAWGEWEQLERSAASGLAAYAAGARAGVAAVEAAADRFRHERRLVAADDAERWLARRGVSPGEFLLGIERRLVARPLPEAPRAPLAATWLEAVCSGAVDRIAARLAEGLAAWDALGRAGEPSPAALDAAVGEFRAAAATQARVAAEIASRQLDWTRLELLVCHVSDRDAAREVVHCVREDGRALGELGLALQVREIELGGAAPGWTGLRAGELHGPVAVSGGYEVSLVRARREPHAGDPMLRARAAAAVADRALLHEVARRVRWHERAGVS